MLSIPKEAENYVQIKRKTCFLGSEEGVIFTYTVLPTNEKGELPKKKSRYGCLEDNTYLHHPETRVVYRGCSDLVLPDGRIINLRGLEKFTGTTDGDEDDEEEGKLKVVPMIDFKLLFSLSEEKRLSVDFQEKANGKMTLFTLFKYKDIDYLFGGSKNVHVIVPFQEEVSGQELHFRMLAQIQKDLRKIELTPFYTKTVVGEYADGQHIIYTPTIEIVYFTEGLGLPAIKKLLPTQTILPTQDQLEYLRNLTNTEGCVIVYRDTQTGQIWRQKHKAKEYIILRVIREALCKRSIEESVGSLVEHVYSRIKARSDSFLSLKEEELSFWRERISSFVSWIKKSMYSLQNLSFSDSIGMAKVWHEFLISPTRPTTPPIVYNRHTRTDYVPLLYPELLSSISFTPICFIMQGLPGSGKSTLCSQIKDICKYRGLSYASFSTDDLFTTPEGKYVYDRTKLDVNHKENYRRFCESKADVVCIDNTNLTEKEYGKYVIQARAVQHRLVVFLTTSRRDADSLLHTNIHSVPKGTIVRMAGRLCPAKPSYYGVFFKTSDLEKIPSRGVTQQTPLHVTFLFSREIYHTFMIIIGKTEKFSIIGEKTCQAGRCLLVTLNDDQKKLYKNEVKPHITVHTEFGFSPVNVGFSPGEETLFPQAFEVSGMYGVMF